MIIPFNNSPGTKKVGSQHLKVMGHLEGKFSLTDNRKVMGMVPIITK
jgi:hypothetical protein